MTRRRAYLVLTLLFSLLFIALVALASYSLSVQQRAVGVAVFLFAFAAALGQMACLGLYVRSVAYDRAKMVALKQHQDI